MEKIQREGKIRMSNVKLYPVMTVEYLYYVKLVERGMYRRETELTRFLRTVDVGLVTGCLLCRNIGHPFDEPCRP